ncbi:MAG: Obg family GTPase CgtA [Candidatus Omnitrophota bacterium]
MFIDFAKITVIAGSGGNGVDSLYKDMFNRKGFPDGGDGGHGGDILLRVSTNVHTLLDFKYKRIFKADRGRHGSGKKKRGRDGKVLIIPVPCGTLVYQASNKVLLGDLLDEGDELIVAKGGVGGRGNRSKKEATAGEEGETQELFLELKLIADIGIIGFPNAGKSTLLSNISKAHPRIASFPFTTKAPVLGTVYSESKKFIIAEIPGIIEGAHQGKGLGDKFLRHAERTKLFVHLLDISKADVDTILADFYKLNNELTSYGNGLNDKKQIIVANKMDCENSKVVLNSLMSKLKKDIIGVSAKEKTGLNKLTEVLFDNLYD